MFVGRVSKTWPPGIYSFDWPCPTLEDTWGVLGEGRDRKKGKPAARRGRNAHGPPEEVAGLPERQGHGRAVGQEERWQPSAALTGALEEASLLPGATLDGGLAGRDAHPAADVGRAGRL